ncbi:MAG: diguanylate cyclase [Candidatus Nanoarchaeia archaeon]|nr:diguanylate cyclase [Candidatus Nanoarchaeia archaeon]
MKSTLEDRVESPGEIERARAWIAQLERRTEPITSEKAEANAKKWHEGIQKSDVNIDRKFVINYMEKILDTESTKLTYARIDADEMGRINDHYGRYVGDLVIKEIRNIAEKILKDNDTGYTLKRADIPDELSKGDQFILILNQSGISADQDLEDIKDSIEYTLANRVYNRIVGDPMLSPELLDNLKNEKFTVSIGYTKVDNIRLHYQEENPCSTVTLLEKLASHNLKRAKQIKNHAFGL